MKIKSLVGGLTFCLVVIAFAGFSVEKVAATEESDNILDQTKAYFGSEKCKE